jgi:hypothetical protein
MTAPHLQVKHVHVPKGPPVAVFTTVYHHLITAGQQACLSTTPHGGSSSSSMYVVCKGQRAMRVHIKTTTKSAGAANFDDTCC